MKMAKADHAEWQKCMDFAGDLEQNVRDLDDEQLGRWVKENYVWLGRVLYGYRVLVDNACDPNADTLEWKPEIAAAMEAYRKPDVIQNTTSESGCRPDVQAGHKC